MKLITRAEQIGLTWPGTTRRARSILQQPKTQQNYNSANSVVHGRIWPNFELIQALMYIIITCKYEMNPIKNVRENVMTPFFPL